MGAICARGKWQPVARQLVLTSRAFADFVESDFDLERAGEHPVRGFNDPIELFAHHG
jgi:adenylate cyclase